MISLFEIRMLLPICLALILGAILGWQRVQYGRAAGPRTYGLVTLGSALFTLLSLNAFVDTSRVAAGIVTGIGFLGAGMIMRKEDHVEGLTTAAGLWVAAGIGMAVGSGYYLLAILSTIIVFLLFIFDDSKLKIIKEPSKNNNPRSNRRKPH
ncbi:MAG: MgtC/SapB family protein [bacterium]